MHTVPPTSELKPGKFVVEQASKDREFAVGVAPVSEAVHKYQNALKSLQAQLDGAQMTMIVALAKREDMHEVIAEAKGEAASGR
jgi:hypothetical protein